MAARRPIRRADGNGNAPAMKKRRMDLYFTEGADLTNRAVLVQAATDVGLNPNDVRAALDSEKDITEIEQEENADKEAGIQGVPCFILDGKYAISGAQAPEALAEAIQQISQQAAEL